MLLIMSLLLQAGGGAPGSMGGLMQFLPFLLIFLVIYFLMIRPQSKKQKKQREMLSNLKAGDEIITIGGIHGTIAGIREKDNALIVKSMTAPRSSSTGVLWLVPRVRIFLRLNNLRLRLI